MTMTRETKVGVVVCLSFLCLVGVVLGTKLRGDATEEDELALKEEVIAEPQSAPPGDNPPRMRIPAKPGEAGSPPVIQTGAVQDAQPLPPPPSSFSQGQNRVAAPFGPASEVPPPQSKQETSSPVSATVTGIPFQDALAPDSSESLQGPRPLVTPANVAALSLWGALQTRLASDPLAVVSETVATAANRSGPGDVEPPTPAAAEAKDDRLPPGPASDQKPLGPSSALVRGANPTNELPGRGNSSKSDEVTLSMNPPPAVGAKPSAQLLAPVPPSAASAGVNAGAVAERTPGNAAAVPGPEQPGRASPAQPVVQVSATENPRRVGEAPTATTPPIPVPGLGTALLARPAAPANPQVESYDEEIYRIKAGDTFDLISAAHFNTDKYAKALERWNASHPQASEHLRANPPVLESGQLLYVPPAYMLEKRYGSLVPGYKPRAQAAEGDPQRTANASPRVETAGTAKPNYKWYVVSPEGQMMRDVARATLEDPGRWGDISKLNPATDPAYRLPGGSLIKVPADARIPAAN